MSKEENKGKLKFEDALAKIEGIVSQLETGKLTLEESLSKFQEGIGLIKHCQEDLNQAEQKIEMLVNSEDENRLIKVKNGEEGACS